MYANIINSYRNVVAIADKELIGKKFEEEGKQLDVKESFYKGEDKENKPKTEEEIKRIMLDWKGDDATFNIVGEKSINLAIQTGIITQESIGKIQNIPYALILL